MKIRIVTYKRKSAKEEVDREEPLARQDLLIGQARRWKGEMDQEELVAELVDLEISGSTDRRPDLQRLMRMARENQFQRAYIGITSRLFRDLPNGPELLYELREILGKEIIFGDVLVPQSDPYYKRYEAQRFLDAQTASIDGSVGARTGQAQLFKDGYKVGGRPRYGYLLRKVPRGRDRKGAVKYNSTIEINPATFPIAKEILVRWSEGKIGEGGLAAELAGRRIPCPTAWDSWGNLIGPNNFRWTKSHIHQILSDAEWTYSGHYRANYCSTRIKHGNMAGQYKGGGWEGKVYRGQKYKPMTEWRIRKDNHPAAIDAETCAKIVARRNQNRAATPSGRRRSPAHPFPVLCTCGSLYSRTGDGLLRCSGRDRKLKECNNRGIKEAVLYPFVVRSLVRHTGLLDDPEGVLIRIRELQAESAGRLPAEIRLKEKQLADKKRAVAKYQTLFEEDRLEPDLFVGRVKELQKDIEKLNDEIRNLRRAPMDTTPFHAGDIFERIHSGASLETPEAIQSLTPHMRKLISYVRINPPDFEQKKRTVEIYYSPALRSALNHGVPKGTHANLTETQSRTIADLIQDLQFQKIGSLLVYVSLIIFFFLGGCATNKPELQKRPPVFTPGYPTGIFLIPYGKISSRPIKANYEALFKSVKTCTRLEKGEFNDLNLTIIPDNFPLFSKHDEWINGEFRIPNFLMIRNESPEIKRHVFQHEVIHYLLYSNTGDADPNHNSRLFLRCLN